MGEQQKSAKEMIIDGKNGGCGPVQQGLARNSTQEPHLEMRGLQPRGWMAEPSMALPAVHKAPPGTDAMDAGWVARWLTGGGSIVVCPRDRCMCVRTCWWSVGMWLCSRGPGPRGSQRHRKILENVNL